MKLFSFLLYNLSRLTGINPSLRNNSIREISYQSVLYIGVSSHTNLDISPLKLKSNMNSKRSSCFQMSPETLEVPMTLFEENRCRLRAKIAQKQVSVHPVVFLQGGSSVNHYNTDVEYVFRQESNFHWMFGVTEPDFFGALDIYSGKSYLFIPHLPDEYAIWMGKLLKPEDVKAKYNVNYVYYVDDMARVLTELELDSLLILSGRNTDSGIEYTEPTFEGISKFKVNSSALYPEITECRVVKTQQEIKVMRYVCKVSSEAHKRVMKMVKGGMHEYQAEAAFLYYCYSTGGCRHSAYTSICGTGCNCATLHYGHAAAPNAKKIEDGDLCLFDMGGSYYGYCADITCTYPVSGKFSEKQKIVYNAVLSARNAVLQAMQPGVSWVEMHMLANKVMLSELKHHGLLNGDVEEMIKNGVAAVFQPHGLGHFLGCDVHDVGGYMKYTPERPTEPGLNALRTARKLKAGMIITVEPGCYFIDELLQKAYNDDKKKKFLNKEIIEEFKSIGGVRIEDDVLVTEHGIENLVDVPRRVGEIEKFMEKEFEDK